MFLLFLLLSLLVGSLKFVSFRAKLPEERTHEILKLPFFRSAIKQDKHFKSVSGNSTFFWCLVVTDRSRYRKVNIARQISNWKTNLELKLLCCVWRVLSFRWTVWGLASTRPIPCSRKTNSTWNNYDKHIDRLGGRGPTPPPPPRWGRGEEINFPYFPTPLLLLLTEFEHSSSEIHCYCAVELASRSAN